MSKTRPAGAVRKTAAVKAGNAPLIDLERYVPALITFIANTLSRSATALYQRRFHVNVTEWRILALLAIAPGATAARVRQEIGFHKGPVSPAPCGREEPGLGPPQTAPHAG